MLIEEKKGSYRLGFKDSEYDVFYNKFYGSLIFRGRKSYAFRMFDNILFNFKNQLKVDPYIELRKAIENLIPILGITKKRIGKVYHSVPKMAVGNRRFVIMLN
jgi:ribosomal protein S7